MRRNKLKLLRNFSAIIDDLCDFFINSQLPSKNMPSIQANDEAITFNCSFQDLSEEWNKPAKGGNKLYIVEHRKN